ncbi:MAG: hypothetical protein SFV22_05385 [Saprospiraceae bacterium]|nr:hypothetical protein [Saprospiraceae bacterium]
MTKQSVVAALALLLLYASCQNNPQAPGKPATEEAKNSDIKSAPDPNDLLRALQGRWQSESDPQYILEIADTQMRHINNGNMTAQSMIDVDGACQSPVCKPGDTDTSDGWCFLEQTIVNGKFEAQCHFVTQCDNQRLHYRDLGAAGGGLAFKKIQ